MDVGLVLAATAAGLVPVDIPYPADNLVPADIPVPADILDQPGVPDIPETAAIQADRGRKAESIQSSERIHLIHSRRLSMHLDRMHCSMAIVADECGGSTVVTVRHVAVVAVVAAAEIPAFAVVLLQHMWGKGMAASTLGIRSV